MIKLGLIVAVALLLIVLPSLVMAQNQIEIDPGSNGLSTVPLQPAKVNLPIPLQGPPGSQDPDNPIGFLTGSSAGDPLDIALDYIRRNKESLKLTEDDLADLLVKDQYLSKHNGVTHIYLRQRLAGIEVFNGDINVNISSAGEVINLVNGFVSDLKNVVNVKEPTLPPTEAANRAVQHLGLTVTEPLILRRTLGGPAQEVTLSDGGISSEDIPLKLMYQPFHKEARLAWELVIRLKNDQNWWSMRVDALTGEILAQNDWITHDSYNVFALPKEHPNDGPRTLEVNPAAAVASPYGWHDINGVAGAEYTVTRGNNVSAQEDLDANNSGGFQPDGGVSLVFSTTLDLTLDPSTYMTASIINLFYWNNILHDLHYQYGFDESSGNFQQNNYGNGGSGSDPVQADALDGSGTNNANFGTPPDGFDPRMQMYRFTYTTPNRDSDLDSGIIAHEYGHGVSNRLTGGPSNVSCLNNLEQMGEGWSDLHAMFLTAVVTDTGPMGRGMGTYVLGQPVTGAGIRNFPYSTDMGVNPQTYDDIKTTNIPHGIGEIWAAMVWEVYWNLVADYGFAPDFYGGSGGNNLTMQLVMDGMKLQPCSPGFVDGRDAILLADQTNNGGVNQCRIWEGFAKRGLGYSASQGSSASRSDGTEAFDLPLQCINELVLTKSAVPPLVQPDDILSYTLTAYNGTTGTLTSVVITDSVPISATYVPGSASDGGSESGGVVQWNIGTMNPNDSVTRTFQVTVDPNYSNPVPFFSDNMESGGGNWTADGLWHLEDDGDACGNSYSPTTSWYYGQPPACTYDTGATNSGRLTTIASVALPAGQTSLTFQSWEDTENFAPYDSRQLFISTNGTNFTSIWNSTNNAAAWYEVSIDLSAYAGQNIWLRFEFDTLDNITNNYIGWYVDDVRIGPPKGIFNTAYITSTQGKSYSATVFTPVTIPRANLSADKGVDKESGFNGDVLTYTISIINSGLLSATNTTLTDTLPAEITYIPGSLNTQGSPPATFNGSDIIWIGTLPTEQAITFTFQATVTGAAGSITNTAIISHSSLTSPLRPTTVGRILEVAACNFSAGFETGTLSQYWDTYTTNEGRIRVDPSYPHTGNYSVLLDDSVDGSAYSYAAIILNIDLAAQSDVELDFWWRGFNDEDHPADGVFFSDDGGASWLTAQNFSGTPSTFINSILDVDDIATSNGLTLNDHFLIKFQFYDNYSITTDGYAIDDVQVICPNELELTKSAAPSSVQPGQVLSYTLTAHSRTSILTGVMITDSVPISTTYVPGSASNGGSESDGVVQWNIGTMLTNTVVTRTFQVTVDPNFSGSPGIAKTSVVITDSVPVNTTYVPGSASNGGSESDEVVHSTIGTMLTNTVVPPTFQVAVDPNFSGSITNTAYITSTQGISNSVTISTPVIIPSVDLSADKRVDKELVFNGDVLTYTIIITNSGLLSATNTTLTDTLPAEITYIPGSLNTQGSPPATFNGSDIIWIGTLPTGQAITFTFQATVTGAAGPITNTAIISQSTLPDSVGASAITLVAHNCNLLGNPITNCSFETADFTGWITTDLTSPFFSLSVNGARVTPGFGFFLSQPTEGAFAALHGFDGNGPGTIRIAQDVTLPPGLLTLEFDYRAAWDLFNYGAALDRLFLLTVEPVGGGSSLQTTSILTAAVGTYVRDTGELKGGVDLSAFAGSTVRISFDWVVPENFSGPAFFQLDNVLINSVNPSITKTVQLTNDPAQRSDPITYTIVVANSGGMDATNVRITDTLPTYINGADLDQTVTITAGDRVTFTINAIVDSGTPYDEVITNTAYYSHPSGNGQDSITFTIESASPALSITNTVELTNDPAQRGDPITYTIVVANSGGVDASNTRITDTLPTYVNGSDLDQTVTVTAGDRVTFTINAIVDSGTPYDEVITNTACYSHPSGTGQDSATFTVSGDNSNVYLPVILKN